MSSARTDKVYVINPTFSFKKLPRIGVEHFVINLHWSTSNVNTIIDTRQANGIVISKDAITGLAADIAPVLVQIPGHSKERLKKEKLEEKERRKQERERKKVEQQAGKKGGVSRRPKTGTYYLMYVSTVKSYTCDVNTKNKDTRTLGASERIPVFGQNCNCSGKHR